jgi:gluconolactonase
VTALAHTDAHEGPVYVAAEDALYFTTQGGAVRRLELGSGQIDDVPADVVRANGMTLDRDGSLLICQQGSFDAPAAIRRFREGRTETVVDSWRGLPLNSPNDVVVKSDGTIWFTDPGYGFLQGFRPEPQLGDYVYRYDPESGDLDVVADSFDKPNGLAFSPDESVLYVGDSEGPHHILAFNMLEGRRLGAPRLFAVISPGYPDGIKVDAAGRVYSSSASGIQVFSWPGDFLYEIELPGAVHFAFGEHDDLLITADDAIWRKERDPWFAHAK